MKGEIKYLIYLSVIMQINMQDDFPSETVEHCRERNRLISTEKGDLYALVDATLSEKLILQCHYCKETDDISPKLWYVVDVFGVSEPKEVKLDMENEGSHNRIRLTSEHSLNILNFTDNDTGVYFCIGLEEQDTTAKINYLVDLTEKANVSNIETGNITNWLEYHEDNMLPINHLFKNSLSPEYVYIREKLKLSLELKTDWETWGPCEVCGRPENGGVKKRNGRCRIKIEQIQRNVDYRMFTPNEIFLVNAFEISCRSLLIQRLTPTIFNSTRIVADFQEIQPCEGICNPDVVGCWVSLFYESIKHLFFKDAEGANAGWKVGKTKSFKYRKTIVMPEGDHLTLICPESTMENKVIWKRNGKELKRGESVKPDKPNEEPRILVDTFSTLYLVEVKTTEEGNYTCLVDDIRMQQIIVYVTSSSKLFTHLFLRHLLYLGFVLSLTLTCYIGGLIIVCTRRYTFKTYKMLKEDAQESGTEDSGDDV